MHAFAFAHVLAFLTCMGCGRRMQTTSELLHDGWHEEAQHSQWKNKTARVVEGLSVRKQSLPDLEVVSPSSLKAFAALLFALGDAGAGWQGSQPRILMVRRGGRRRMAPPHMELPSWVPMERADEISEPEAQAAFSTMEAVDLKLPTSLAAGPCTTRYLKTAVDPDPTHPPVLLVHGFDISCLEYRRLLPQLEALGIEAYAPCIAGWGFTETEALHKVGIEAKRAQLLSFWETVLGGRPAVWVGTSLGASIALDCYLAHPKAVRSFVGMAPAFFTPPPPAVPETIGRVMIQNVLSAPAVRKSIAKQAYYVKENQTEDAVRCGNLHLNRAGWKEDSLEWLLSEKYGEQATLVQRLSEIDTLTLWGRQDQVIPPAQFGSWPAAQLVAALPNGAFRWVEDSGHTPHLEQPVVTAAAIAAFARDQPVDGDADTSEVVDAASRWQWVQAAADKLGVTAR